MLLLICVASFMIVFAPKFFQLFMNCLQHIASPINSSSPCHSLQKECFSCAQPEFLTTIWWESQEREVTGWHNMRPTLRFLPSQRILFDESGLWFVITNLAFHLFKLITNFSYQWSIQATITEWRKKMSLTLRGSRDNCWWENRFPTWNPLTVE